MWKIVADILFPKYCVQCKKIGNYICDNCFSYIRFTTATICPVCQKPSIEGATHPKCRTSHNIDGLVSAVVYTGVIRRLIYQFKYSPYVSSLTEVVGSLMCESLEQNETFFNLLQRNCIFTPVSLHSARLKKRGYNHAELLCSYVAQYFNQKYHESHVIRIKNTKPQFRLSRRDRFSNVKNAFAINEKYKHGVKGKTVVVVDDLATTCSTLAEIAKILKRNGATEVWGVVFAREEKEIR